MHLVPIVSPSSPITLWTLWERHEKPVLINCTLKWWAKWWVHQTNVWERCRMGRICNGAQCVEREEGVLDRLEVAAKDRINFTIFPALNIARWWKMFAFYFYWFLIYWCIKDQLLIITLQAGLLLKNGKALAFIYQKRVPIWDQLLAVV